MILQPLSIQNQHYIYKLLVTYFAKKVGGGSRKLSSLPTSRDPYGRVGPQLTRKFEFVGRVGPWVTSEVRHNAHPG